MHICTGSAPQGFEAFDRGGDRKSSWSCWWVVLLPSRAAMVVEREFALIAVNETC